jgi:hypothetical protein
MLGWEKSLQLRTTATPAGVVTFLKASSQPYHLALLDATGETLDPACWFRQWRRFGVVPSMEALFGLLVESLDDSWSHGRLMPGAWATRAQFTLMRELQWRSSQVRSGPAVHPPLLLLGIQGWTVR